MKKSIFIFFVIMICCISHSSISAQIKLAHYVVGNGAVISSNSANTLSATIGQSLVGSTSNSLHSTDLGFWQQYSQTITDVEDMWMYEVPKQFELYQNYPNPFNPTTVIRYGIPKESSVKVIVYNILGEMVVLLVNTTQKTGYYEVSFSASNLASGVYIYTIQSKTLDGSKDFRSVKKMILLK